MKSKPVAENAPATAEENELINICNHTISSDAKVAAIRAHVKKASRPVVETFIRRLQSFMRAGAKADYAIRVGEDAMGKSTQHTRDGKDALTSSTRAADQVIARWRSACKK